MKRFASILITLIGLVCSFSACSHLSEKFEYISPSDEMGTMKLVSPLVSVESRAVNISDFVVRILQGTTLIAEYKSYSKMPEIVSLPVGEYSVEAYSPVLHDAEWDSPYYYGIESFTIEKNKLTEVSTLICYFSNIKVNVAFDDELKPLLDLDVKVNVTIGQGSLDFLVTNPNATGYFKAADVENALVAILTGTVDGQYITSTQTITGVKAGEARQITYSMKKIEEGELAEYGTVIVGGETFKIDATCDLVNLGDITLEIPEQDIQDKPDQYEPEENPGGGDEPGIEVEKPTIVGDGFDIDQAQYPSQYIAANAPMRVFISSADGTTIKDLRVEIDSEKLTPDILISVKLAPEFSLVTPATPELEQGLKDLKFPVGDEITSSNYVIFDITEFLPLLGIYGAGDHNFIITVTDSNDQVTTKTLLLISE